MFHVICCARNNIKKVIFLYSVLIHITLYTLDEATTKMMRVNLMTNKDISLAGNPETSLISSAETS